MRFCGYLEAWNQRAPVHRLKHIAMEMPLAASRLAERLAVHCGNTHLCREDAEADGRRDELLRVEGTGTWTQNVEKGTRSETFNFLFLCVLFTVRELVLKVLLVHWF